MHVLCAAAVAARLQGRLSVFSCSFYSVGEWLTLSYCCQAARPPQCVQLFFLWLQLWGTATLPTSRLALHNLACKDMPAAFYGYSCCAMYGRCGCVVEGVRNSLKAFVAAVTVIVTVIGQDSKPGAPLGAKRGSWGSYTPLGCVWPPVHWVVSPSTRGGMCCTLCASLRQQEQKNNPYPKIAGLLTCLKQQQPRPGGSGPAL